VSVRPLSDRDTMEVPVPTPDTDLDGSAKAGVTIDRPAEDLLALWSAPDTLPRIMSHFATIAPIDANTADWQVDGPLGNRFCWQTCTTVAAPDALDWVSLEGADVPNTGALRLRPAPADRGTEVSLEIAFDVPGGAVGEKIASLFSVVPREIVFKALYKFRALAITGEIPTTDPQPAARSGGQDR
jgi:uncharacterized membrane protein